MSSFVFGLTRVGPSFFTLVDAWSLGLNDCSG